MVSGRHLILVICGAVRTGGPRPGRGRAPRSQPAPHRAPTGRAGRWALTTTPETTSTWGPRCGWARRQRPRLGPKAAG